MVSDILTSGEPMTRERPEPASRRGGGLLHNLLAPLASLRLTVVLFALAIGLIFAGTLAQVDKDIWEVMNLYFRTWFAWIPFKVFFPPVFFPKFGQHIGGGFYFPGGFLIGAAMAVNLLAAHGVRFTVQARGARLAAGLAVLALGVLLVWLVVLGGSDKELVEGTKGLNIPWLWGGVEAALGMLWLSLLYGIWEIGRQRVWERRLLIAAGAIVGIVLGVVLYNGPAVMPDPSAMRILWQLVKATSAALVLLAGCVLVFRKRAGIVLLHAGVGLMMINELVVYSLHTEGVMELAEGERANYVQDIRNVELAVTNPAESAAAQDDAAKSDELAGTLEDVTVVPRDHLKPGNMVRSPLLPFDVEVLDYHANSKLRKARAGEENPATAGAGKTYVLEPVRAGSGTDAMQKVDLPGAYVKLIGKDHGAPLGTYLVSWHLHPQTVEVDGKPYSIALRYKRVYKPYTVELLDVRKDDYLGTNTPRNFSSDVQMIDPAHHVDRQVHIWMNNPLRYAGDTLYQSSYDEGPPERTVLQVVKNTGWMIPYVGCMIVAVGMLAHFSLTLIRFLRRRDAEESGADTGEPLAQPAAARSHRRRTPAASAGPRSRWISVGVPAAIVVVLTGWLMGHARVPQPAEGKFDFYAFGKLPLVYEGRTKPFDTLARNTLMILSGHQSYKDEDGKSQPATRWLLDLVSNDKVGFKHRVLRIENDEVLATFHLKPREGRLYSIAELQPHLQEFSAQTKSLEDVKPADMSIYQKKLINLQKKLGLCHLLMASFTPPEVSRENPVEDFTRQIEFLRAHKAPLPVPPDAEQTAWELYPVAWVQALAAQHLNKSPNPAMLALTSALVAYTDGKANDFNSAVAQYQQSMAANPPADVNLTKVDFEAWFNHFEPFFWAWILDLTALTLTILAWFGWSRPLNRAAFWVLAVTLVVHTLGIVSRIYISGRPPVTNLYSATVFIGWAGMVFGLTLELIYRLGIGNLIASIAGFGALFVAHILAADGDTLIVLQAVLDTQFWLATHVVCVTLGYSATFVAGLLGILYIAHSAVTRLRSPEIGRTLTRMTYGTLCFAIFFSFVGTVLGGLWADDSWGRFWGWDPKENGALMIVAWNALVLHARWGGMVRDRGLAMLAVWGNAVVAWSYFGVNELGIGLHSYGFTEGVAYWLAVFIAAQAAIIGLGLVDRQRSLRRPQPA